MLQQHLSSTLEECQQSIVILQASTAHFDQKLGQSRQKEKELTREIMTLEAGSELMKKQVRYYREQLKSNSRGGGGFGGTGTGTGTGTGGGSQPFSGLNRPTCSPKRPQSVSESIPNSPTAGAGLMTGAGSGINTKQPVALNTNNKTKSMGVVIPSLLPGGPPNLRRTANSAPSTTMHTTINITNSDYNPPSNLNELGLWDAGMTMTGTGFTGTGNGTGSAGAHPFIAESHKSPGKRNILHRYMKTTIDVINKYQPQPSTNTNTNTNINTNTNTRHYCIDLASCELVYEDFHEVISWLRLLDTLKYIQTIDLTFNSLTDDSITIALAAFLISLEDDEYKYNYNSNEEKKEILKNKNENILYIQLSNNLISIKAIKEFHKKLIHLLGRVDIVPLIELSDPNDVITIYGTCTGTTNYMNNTNNTNTNTNNDVNISNLDQNNMPNSKSVIKINQKLKKKNILE